MNSRLRVDLICVQSLHTIRNISIDIYSCLIDAQNLFHDSCAKFISHIKIHF